LKNKTNILFDLKGQQKKFIEPTRNGYPGNSDKYDFLVQQLFYTVESIPLSPIICSRSQNVAIIHTSKFSGASFLWASLVSQDKAGSLIFSSN
jgi:hypothetical protein